MRQNPKPQEIYRHFKGNVYQIITLARNSETDARMVVYQQLYPPYEVYVRPLDMFMSRVDTVKYPNEKQKYRFEKVPAGREDEPEETKETYIEKSSTREQPANTDSGEFELDPGLAEFLDADSYEKKLEILSRLHHRITDDMIDTIAVSLDTEIEDGDIEQRYAQVRNCLVTMERFECNRLR